MVEVEGALHVQETLEIIKPAKDSFVPDFKVNIKWSLHSHFFSWNMAYFWIKQNILCTGLQDLSVLIALRDTPREICDISRLCRKPNFLPTGYFTFSTKHVFYLHFVWRASVTLCTCIQDAICFYLYLLETTSNTFIFFTVCGTRTEELCTVISCWQ